MQVEPDNFMEQPIAKMNSSNAAFKQLIQNLRNKNRNLTHHTLSEINPESDQSNSSQACFSEIHNTSRLQKRLNNSLTAVPINNHKHQSFVGNMPEDNVIKLKPRGNIGRRDILNQKQSPIPSQMFNQTAISLKEQLKNKNVQIEKSKVNQKVQNKSSEDGLLNFKQEHASKHKDAIANISRVLNNIEHAAQISQNKSSEALLVNLNKKNSFNQNKLNSRGASHNKIKDIDDEVVCRYYRNSPELSKFSQAQDIFDFFQGLLQITKIPLQCPLIKKFKNCIYFGQQVNDNQKYEGLLYFYDQKIYYGEFFNGQKNGNGVQIIFSNDQILYKGNFTNGEKTGKFYVRDPVKQHQYMGYLEKGIYHGKGKLVTKEFVYQGDFVKGEKHGFGEQYHPKTGVRFTGYFSRGSFQKRSKSNFGKDELEKGINFKSGSSRAKIVKKQAPFIIPASKSQINTPRMKSPIANYQHKSGDGFQQSPFYSSAGNVMHGSMQARQNPGYNQGSKVIFNKQKIKGYIPHMKSQYNDIMPEKFQDFQYSFDVSSRRDSENSQFLPQFDANIARIGRRNVYPPATNNHYSSAINKGYSHPHVSQFPEIEQQKLDTSECEEPLPVPCFFATNR